MASIDESRTHESGPATKWSEEQRARIWSESQLILSYPSFKNSKRCLTLFQFLIERALAGDPENLKERTLGVEVFGRNPDYDTNADPIVRMTASEIRKRLAQYYQQGDRPNQIRIQLVPGSYVPQFEFVTTAVPELPAESGSVENDGKKIGRDSEIEPASLPLTQRKSRRWWIVGGLGLVALAAVFVGKLALAPRLATTQELVWAPLLNESGPAMLSVSDGYGLNYKDWAAATAGVIAAGKFESPMTKDGHPVLAITDAKVAARVMAFLTVHRHETIMRETAAMTLSDLRQGPDVIVGAFDNPWFMVLMSHMRFHMMVDPVTHNEWIEDGQNPHRRDWMVRGDAQFSDSSLDYALITRVRSPDTGTWILAIGGLGLHATEPAGQLVTDPNFANALPDSLRDTQKNFQIVVKTAVINGNPGPPQVVATYIW